MRRIWRTILVLWLALCVSAPAFALGLGQIQVRSQAGEPLLAEIPVVSSDPRELQQLRARLASPETFTRIGLQAPQGSVADLQFNVALDAQGRPIIRVTTLRPVAEPLLTFLVEVDWGQGRLVREYSALLDAPDTVAAPAQPPIQAPRPAPTQATTAGTIAREPAPQADAAPPPPDEAGQGADDAPEQQAGASAPAADTDTEIAAGDAVPMQAPPSPAAPTAALRSTPGEYGPVQAGDTLSQIVQRIAPDDDVTANQMMLALLRSNPEAFIGGNINRIRQGAVLRMPSREEALSIGVREATAEVRTQVARWRELAQPVATPDAAGGGEAATNDTPAAAAAPGATAAAPDARLEIVPPGEGGTTQAGTRSGIAAGGEGDMLRQEFQQAQETLAARDAEVEDLKARLAELEALQHQQQQLIELKDSELAAVQARLADSNQRESGGGSALPWVGGLLLAILVAGLALWWFGRRDPGRPAFRASASGAPRAAPVPPPAPAPPAGTRPTWHATGSEPRHATAPSAGGRHAATAEEMPAARAGAPVPAEPMADVGAPVPPIDAQGDMVAGGRVAAPSGEVRVDESTVEALEDVQGQERIELARAYVELGDTETARDLLQEALQSDSPGVRAEATRLLDELG